MGGKRRLAYVWVKNSGDAGKGWHWNYDLSVKGVVKEINKYKIRLTDLSSYVVDGKRRYAYIGIANTGADARAWWWYVNVTPKFVQQQAVAHGARLIDVERPKAGRMTVIMQRNDESAYSRFVYDYTQTDLLRFEASNGVRITDLERYKKNGHVRYAASLIDNASPENRRVRSIWRSQHDGQRLRTARTRGSASMRKRSAARSTSAWRTAWPTSRSASSSSSRTSS